MDMVKNYSQTMGIQEAVSKAVDECISRGVLEKFLKKNKAEAIEVTIFEYDEEQHMRTVHQEGYELGEKETELKNIKALMKSLRCTAQEAMEKLAIPVEKRERYLGKL